MRQFAESHAVWEAAVDAVAELDALMSLASVADIFSIAGPMCRPKFVEAPGDRQVSAYATRNLQQSWAERGLHTCRTRENTCY